MDFRVIKIVNTNTIQVSPRWSWQGEAGSLVSIVGFREVNEAQTKTFIINKLTTLLLDKLVELKNPISPVTIVDNDKNLSASVYLNSINISVYFPELKIPA